MLIGYWTLNPTLPNSTPLQVFDRIMSDEQINKYRDGRVSLIDNKYKDIQFPANYETFFVEQKVENEATLASVLNRMKTWSKFNNFLKHDPDGCKVWFDDIWEKAREEAKENNLISVQVNDNLLYFAYCGIKVR